MVSLVSLRSLRSHIVVDKTSLDNMYGEQRARRARRKRGSLRSRSYLCYVNKMLDIAEAKDKEHRNAKSGWLETGRYSSENRMYGRFHNVQMTGLYQEAQLD